ncbi:MAG: glycosyltransferase family 2 protein [Pseudomonadota bacterium]
MPPSLSVIIITKNEADNLHDCLQSLAGIQAELIVVDSGSSDATVQIARDAGATVIQTASWPGFGPQKNIALAAATCDWVLSLDADERLTPALREQILAAISHGAFKSYEMPRLSYFCGQPIRHGGWYPDYILRLFERGHARFSDHLVHERVLADGETGRLDSPLLHYNYRNQGDVERKITSYSDAGAQQLFLRGKQSNLVSAAVHGGWAFIRTYVLRLGFLDGVAGYQIARMNQRSSQLKYAKLCALRSQALAKSPL